MADAGDRGGPAGEHEVARSADAVTMSVLLGRFDSIVSEMSLTLARTAWTPIIAICRDF